MLPTPHAPRRMEGVSWHRGCPVSLGDLRLVKASRIDFHGRPRQGRLVVNEDYAKGMVEVSGTDVTEGLKVVVAS